LDARFDFAIRDLGERLARDPPRLPISQRSEKRARPRPAPDLRHLEHPTSDVAAALNGSCGSTTTLKE
jgi:hypothetical protein